MDNLRISTVTSDELDTFSSILQEAAQWLVDRGQDMWEVQQLTKDKLLESYRLHEMHIGWLIGQSCATIILQEEDITFWPYESVRNESLFIHKLCIRRSFAQAGVSTGMLDWAKNEAIRRNKSYLRLDCAADRPKLVAFYEQYGFVKVREAVMFGKYPTAFYELPLTDIVGL